MLFLTEIKNQKRPASSYVHHSRPGSRENIRKFTKQGIQSKSTVSKNKSSHTISRQENTKIQLEKSIQAMKGRSTAQQKWHRIVDLFHLFKEIETRDCQNSVNPSALSTPQNQVNSLTKLSFTRSTQRYKSKYHKINSNYIIGKLSGQSDQYEAKTAKKSHIHLEEDQKQDKLRQQQKKMIRINIFQIILKANLPENKYKFNIPETIIIDQDRSFQLLSTQKGIIMKKSIKKAETCSILDKGHEAAFKKIKESNIKGIYQQMYQHLIDHKINPMAPYVAISFQNNKNDLSIQVENIRNFGENRWNSNQSCYVQRFVYSRNLKAMVMRIVYERRQRGQQKQQFYINRFQNYSNIFRVNNNGCHDFLDLKVKVAPSYIRQYTLQYSKLTGPGILNKYIEPTTQVRRLIENVHKKRVLRLWVDFIEDLSGTIWVIGVKAVVFQEIQNVQCKELWLMASHVGLCRLCNGVFQKNHLQNSVSVRMLLQFLHHLRRRTRIQNFQTVEFSNSLALNRKENAMSAVCQCCYQLIIRQLQLKKYERQLGRLCHIRVEDEGDPPKIEGKDLHQWRLMVYLEEIIEQTKQNVGQLRSSKAQNVLIRYVLAKGIQQKWKCKVEQKKIAIKKVKVHYFFSQVSNIQEFLKNTEILVSVLSSNKEEKEEVIAQGSTGILANFRNKFVTENGQRQTTTVLLFFESGKYCALTLKVGLVYDGVYKSPEISLKTMNSVLFPTRDCLNSNPLPKEWMEAFGYDEQIHLKQVKYQELFKQKPNLPKKKQLKKKGMKKLF